MTVKNFTLHKENNNINYQLFLPQGYETDRDKKYPLILFLHGSKRRGEDIHLLNDYGLTWIAENKKDFPFIIVTPQCPSLSNWTIETASLITLTNEILSKYRVDHEKIYLTGFSIGGQGSFDLASKYPELFAAVAPIAGWFEPNQAMLLKDVPIWAFHCMDDDVVPVSGTEDMVQALTSIGGNIRVTYYSGLKHDHKVMNETYNNSELYTWLLKHKRKKYQFNDLT